MGFFSNLKEQLSAAGEIAKTNINKFIGKPDNLTANISGERVFQQQPVLNERGYNVFPGFYGESTASMALPRPSTLTYPSSSFETKNIYDPLTNKTYQSNLPQKDSQPINYQGNTYAPYRESIISPKSTQVQTNNNADLISNRNIQSSSSSTTAQYQPTGSAYVGTSGSVQEYFGNNGEKVLIYPDGGIQKIQAPTTKTAQTSGGGGYYDSSSGFRSGMGITGATAPLTSIGQGALTYLPETEEERKKRASDMVDIAKKKLLESGASDIQFFGNTPETLAAWSSGQIVVPAGQMEKYTGLFEPKNKALDISPTTIVDSETFGSATGTPKTTADIQKLIASKMPQMKDTQSVIEARLNNIKGLISSNISSQKTGELQNELEGYKQLLLEQQSFLNTIPNNPMPTDESLTTDPIELDKIKNVPIDYKEQIFNKYDLTARIKEMETMRNKIVAEAEAYDSLIKDIKEDPDFPIKLASKRTKMFEDARDTNLKALELKYKFLVDAYNQSLSLAKEELGLYQNEEQKQERERDNIRQQVNQLISSGTLGDLDQQTLTDLATRGGYGITEMTKLAEAVRNNQGRKVEKYLQDMEDKAMRLDLAMGRFEIAQNQSNLTGTTGASYESRLQDEIKNLYSGIYGTQGGREKIINVLKNEFPNVDVAKDIYNRIPDGWETNIKQPEMSSWEVDASIWQWLSGDGASFDDEEKKIQIQKMGRNPNNFGIY